MALLGWTLFVMVIARVVCVGHPRCGLEIDDGGYSGLVVHVEDVNVTDKWELIQQIQVHFTEGSAALYAATGHRLYFKNITIVVPRSWANLSGVQESEQPLQAHFVVQDANPLYGDVPYVVHEGTCDTCGQYAHFTPEYLLNNYISSGKTIAHEFAHLRWGVGEEYPVDLSGTRQSRVDTNGKPIPNTCTQGMNGSWVVPYSNAKCDPLNETLCVFKPDGNQTTNSSIMGYHFIESVTSFCNDKNHDSEADTLQNARCNGKSVMEVVKDSGDLNNISQTFGNTTPNFDLVTEPLNDVIVFAFFNVTDEDTGTSEDKAKAKTKSKETGTSEYKDKAKTKVTGTSEDKDKAKDKDKPTGKSKGKVKCKSAKKIPKKKKVPTATLR